MIVRFKIKRKEGKKKKRGKVERKINRVQVL
jgi:hypothetical protein